MLILKHMLVADATTIVLDSPLQAFNFNSLHSNEVMNTSDIYKCVRSFCLPRNLIKLCLIVLIQGLLVKIRWSPGLVNSLSIGLYANFNSSVLDALRD